VQLKRRYHVIWPICSHNYGFYSIAHITMLWTTVMKTSYLYRVASKAQKLFRSSRREWWWWWREIQYSLYYL